MYMHMSIYTYICMCICICICTCIYLYVYMYMYKSIYTCIWMLHVAFYSFSELSSSLDISNCEFRRRNDLHGRHRGYVKNGYGGGRSHTRKRPKQNSNYKQLGTESSASVSAAAFSSFLSVAAFLLLLIGGFLNLLVRQLFFLLRLMFRFVDAIIRLR